RARRFHARLAVRHSAALRTDRASAAACAPRGRRGERDRRARRGGRGLVGAGVAFNPFALPVRRPTATSMFFLALVMLGLFAWYRIPIELLPALGGEQLSVNFGRQGSEPEVVER